MYIKHTYLCSLFLKYSTKTIKTYCFLILRKQDNFIHYSFVNLIQSIFYLKLFIFFLIKQKPDVARNLLCFPFAIMMKPTWKRENWRKWFEAAWYECSSYYQNCLSIRSCLFRAINQLAIKSEGAFYTYTFRESFLLIEEISFLML